jgi:surfactin synthase thioesterase subunit
MAGAHGGGPAAYCTGRLAAPAVRLICFPFAGSGISTFQGWRLPAELAGEVWTVRLPGRESRWREPLPSSLPALLDDLVQQVDVLLDRPFAFFGHSMGALVAFEMARLLIRRGGQLPVRLFLSAHRAPDRPPKREPMSVLTDEQLLARLLEMAGPSRSAVRDPELLMLAAPVVRADVGLCERYRYQVGTVMSTPVTCFAAVDDSEVDVPDVAAWQWHTRSPGRLVTFSGGHLFLRDRSAEILREITYDLVAGPAP